MPVDERYRRQVALLVRVLPFVAEENCFALKGGTAINLFIRDLPRLSIDIDLAYLPVADREESLRDIETALCRIQQRVEGSNPVGSRPTREVGRGRRRTGNGSIRLARVQRGRLAEEGTINKRARR